MAFSRSRNGSISSSTSFEDFFNPSGATTPNPKSNDCIDPLADKAPKLGEWERVAVQPIPPLSRTAIFFRPAEQEGENKQTIANEAEDPANELTFKKVSVTNSERKKSALKSAIAEHDAKKHKQIFRQRWLGI